MSNISIIIPYHGRIELLKETLNSLVEQTIDDFEVIISDDSTEQNAITPNILENYSKNLNLKYIRTKANLGPIPNTLQGISKASNDYIHILHSDDILSPNCIKFETELINKYPSNLFITHINKNFTDHFNYDEHNLYYIKNPMENWLSADIFTGTTVPSAWCFNKKMLDFVTLSDKDFSFVYDWNFLFEAFMYHYKNNLSFIEIPMGYVGWRDSLNNESSKGALVLYKEWKILLNKIYSNLKSENILSNRKLFKLKKQSQRARIKRVISDYIKSGKNFKLPLEAKPKYIAKCILKFIYNKECVTTNRITFTILGIKISIKKNSCKKFQLNVVPLMINNSYFNLKNYPVQSSDYQLYSDNDCIDSIAIVMQGPIIKENDFTLETCKIYKKIFNNNEKIILSTWSTEDKNYLKRFKDLNIDIVQSKCPDFAGRANLNYQIVSTLNGIKEAKKLGSNYILKTRTDQRFYKPNISRNLLNLIKMFSLPKKDYKLKSRLIVLSFNSFKYRYYGLSDMFLFGKTEDVLNYWNIPLDTTPYKEYENIPLKTLFQKYCSETYIATHFLENLEIKPDYTLMQTWQLYKDLFIFIDREFLELYWPKYTSLESRWHFFYHNMLEEMSFNEWLNLYLQNDIKKINENVNYIMPKIGD